MASLIRPCLAALAVGSATAMQIQSASQCIPEAKDDGSLRDVNAAFVMGGIGKYGRFPGLNKCVALGETLGRIGGWPGKVYIMTDTLPNATELSKATAGNPNIKFIKIPPIRDGVDFRLDTNGPAGGGGGYMKTMMFDLPEIKEDVLIWHDCDKMIGETGCITDMWRSAPLEFGPDKEFYLGLLPGPIPCANASQNPNTTVNGVFCKWDNCHKGWGKYADRCGDGVHVGVFAAHRRWSKAVMDLWKQNQQNEPGVYDRYTFWDAWMKLGSAVRGLPAAWADQMYSKKAGVQCVNHMSGPRVWAEDNRGFLEPYLRSMCLQGVSYAEAYDIYANILKFKIDRWGNEEIIKEQRYFPLK